MHVYIHIYIYMNINVYVYICTCKYIFTLLFLLVLTYVYTANRTWGSIFESSNLKARTSLLPHFNEKRRSSFEL